MKTTKFCALRWLAILIMGIALPINATMGEYQIIDRVVAIVEDDVVLASEIRDQLTLIKTNIQRRGGRLPPESVLYEQILESLILDKLQLQRAQRIGMRITDQELNEALTSMAAQNQLSLSDFRQALEAEGQSYVGLREQTRRDMLLRRIQQRNVMRSINISPSEIDNFLSSEAGKKLLQVEYSIDHILLPIASNATEAAVERARSKTETLRQKASEHAQFVDISTAIEQAEATHAPLGWRTADDIPSMLADAAISLEQGEISEPILSDSGFHLVRINRTRGGVAEQSTENKVRHILLKESEIRDREQTLLLMDSILEELASGVPFVSLARMHSDDPGSALKGGDLGWTLPGVMVPAFEERMLNAEVGVVSEPFESKFGWHILLVEDRRVKDLTQDNARQMARLEIAKSKYDDELNNWLQEIRDNSFVEIK